MLFCYFPTRAKSPVKAENNMVQLESMGKLVRISVLPVGIRVICGNVVFI